MSTNWLAAITVPRRWWCGPTCRAYRKNTAGGNGVSSNVFEAYMKRERSVDNISPWKGGAERLSRRMFVLRPLACA